MHRIEEKIIQGWPIENWSKMTLLLAVSGGADSVALLRAIKEVASPSTRLGVAHFNHGLRGLQSDGDAQFVKQLADQLECPFFCNSLSRHSEPSGNHPKGESALRQVRYQFLAESAHRFGGRYLVTAHTLDDQAETVLFQLFRGTGIGGIAGMRPFSESTYGSDLVLARPLLEVHRYEILEYLEAIGQEYRDDSSNAGTDYSRNWIRHKIFPMIEERFANAKSAIARTARLHAEVESMLEDQSRSIVEPNVQLEGERGFSIEASLLIGAPWPLVFVGLKRTWMKLGWPLREMSNDHWMTLRRFLDDSASKVHHRMKMPHVLPGEIHVEKRGGRIYLERRHLPIE